MNRPLLPIVRSSIRLGLLRVGGLALLGTSLAFAAAEHKTAWDFESDRPGAIARGFTSEIGTWEVAKDGENHVLAQKARNDDSVFNIALADAPRLKDVDVSVRVKSVAGEVDNGGGVVWRALDKDNYYVVRYNPLEDNFRLYRIKDGKRHQLRSVKVPGEQGWHTVRATMNGARIACYLDGKNLLEADDDTFPGAGRAGVWTKSDAQSYFDDLTVSGE